MNIVCRQGIYNREGDIAFYEVMLQDRKTGAYPKGFDYLKATSISIDLLTEMGGKGKDNVCKRASHIPQSFHV